MEFISAKMAVEMIDITRLQFRIVSTSLIQGGMRTLECSSEVNGLMHTLQTTIQILKD